MQELKLDKPHLCFLSLILKSFTTGLRIKFFFRVIHGPKSEFQKPAKSVCSPGVVSKMDLLPIQNL